MAIRKILYPVDITGTADSNRIVGEEHTIGVTKYRAFALQGGPFFANSRLEIVDISTNNKLIEGRDYTLLYSIPELVKLTEGKKICGVILIHNKNISTRIKVTYNVVGGTYVSMNVVIQKAIDDLELDNRNTYWRHVLEKPDVFQAAPHDHDIGDVFGFEYQIAVLDDIVSAIGTGNSKVTDEILITITSEIARVSRIINDHKMDRGNPHVITPTQLNVHTKNEIQTIINGINSRFDSLEPRFAALLKAVADNLTKINRNERALITHGNRVSSIETRFGTYNNSIAQLNSVLDKVNKDVAALKKTQHAHAASINTNTASINALVVKDRGHDSRLTSLESRCQGIEGVNKVQNVDIENLRRKDAALAQSISTVNNTLSTRITNVDARVTELSRRVDNISNSIKLSWGGIQITGYLNWFDNPVDWTAPAGSVMVGEYPYHNDHCEDRRFRFRYRSLGL